MYVTRRKKGYPGQPPSSDEPSPPTEVQRVLTRVQKERPRGAEYAEVVLQLAPQQQVLHGDQDAEPAQRAGNKGGGKGGDAGEGWRGGEEGVREGAKERGRESERE